MLATLTAVVMVLTSCSSTGGAAFSNEIQAVDSFADITQPSIAVATEGGGRLAPNAVVEPGLPIVVTASRGALTNVRIPTASGRPLAGSLSEDGSTWTSTQPLGYSKRYVVQAEAVGVGGRSVVSQRFTTTSPESLTSAAILGEETVGIAHTIGVRFADPIPDRKKAQAAITVSSDPQMQGAFYWISDSEVRWRPERFWTPGTKVSVAVNIYGVNLGDGLYGDENLSYDFTIGRAQEIVADDNTKTIVVKRDGKVIRTMPTSFGKDSTPTPRGIYMIGDRVEHIIMDSSTYGVPVESAAGYRTPVQWAVQMSYSGIYMHGAPWSMSAQGNSNVSNGCPNLSPADAEWLVKNTLRGDPVTVKNTNADTLSGVDGLGDWNIPWSQWKKGNADT
ncbi:Ig-like domain-containing protein [Gordonia sp. Swx-4]|uniref:L,D-transpeptidase n=1 Tax=Gordonia sp. Swx-4 TaxID=3029399 RepID=UPI0025736223|nr:Ig-like domain-containing protein [Gordonia sp. Swx-4]WJG15521.1 Ig-like domain-containing protein [Gordonia sp. Swx-4]